MWGDTLLWVWFVFLWYLMMSSTFSYTICMCFLEKQLFKSFAHSFNQVLCFSAIELYKFLTHFRFNPLSYIWFANMFFHYVGCLFILMIMSSRSEASHQFLTPSRRLKSTLPWVLENSGSRPSSRPPALLGNYAICILSNSHILLMSEHCFTL